MLNMFAGVGYPGGIFCGDRGCALKTDISYNGRYCFCEADTTGTCAILCAPILEGVEWFWLFHVCRNDVESFDVV